MLWYVESKDASCVGVLTRVKSLSGFILFCFKCFLTSSVAKLFLLAVANRLERQESW